MERHFCRFCRIKKPTPPPYREQGNKEALPHGALIATRRALTEYYYCQRRPLRRAMSEKFGGLWWINPAVDSFSDPERTVGYQAKRSEAQQYPPIRLLLKAAQGTA